MHSQTTTHEQALEHLPPASRETEGPADNDSPSWERRIATEINQSLSEVFVATVRQPRVWSEALTSLGPHRPTRTRRAFRDFMAWDEDRRCRAMAELEGAIDWAQAGRPHLLLDALKEHRLSPRMAHAIMARWPESNNDVARASYNRWRNSVNQLARQYQKLAFKIANQFQAKVKSDGDWVSHAFMALLKAAELYEPDGAEFMTFAYRWIQLELKKAYGQECERRKLTVSLSDTHHEDREPSGGGEFFASIVPGPNQQFVVINRRKEIAAAVSVLTERERQVIQRFFGLNELEEKETAEEISKDLGVSRARICQIKAEAIAKMQGSAA